MKGFDYRLGSPIDRTVRRWKEVAAEVAKEGGFIREDRRLGETFIHSKNAVIVCEVYGVNLNLDSETTR